MHGNRPLTPKYDVCDMFSWFFVHYGSANRDLDESRKLKKKARDKDIKVLVQMVNRGVNEHYINAFRSNDDGNDIERVDLNE